jgi:hypothetical protein
MTHLDICDISIPISNAAKNIGVILDTHLNMDKQVTATSNAAMFHLRRIAKIRNCISQSACEKLVHALISSRIDYGNAVLYGIPKYRLDILQRVMNIAARIVTKTLKYDHITPVLLRLHWLPVQQRIEYKVLLQAFRTYHQIAPGYLNELVSKYEPARSLRLSNSSMMVVPKVRTKRYGTRKFEYADPYLWNLLPEHLRVVYGYATLKKQLKTHLFRKAYDIL